MLGTPTSGRPVPEDTSGSRRRQAHPQACLSVLVVGLIAELDNSTECVDTFPLRKTHFYSTFIPGTAFVSKKLQNFYKILTNRCLVLVTVAPIVGIATMSFLDTTRYHQYVQGRSRQTHCRNGHPLTPQNTRLQTCERNGRTYVVRSCRACERNRRKKLQFTKPAAS